MSFFDFNDFGIKAVLWDCDGVLIDSERVYTQVTNLVLAPYGLSLPWSVKATIMGRKERDASQFVVNALGVPLSVDEYINKIRAYQIEGFKTVSLMPGALRLVKYFERIGIPQAIATSSRTESFKMKTAHNQHLFGKFFSEERIVRGDDPRVKAGKPAPDIFIAAAKTIGIHDPQDYNKILVFEDSPEGVKAALAAGMRVIWVPMPQIRRELDEAQVGATSVLNSLLDFDPMLFYLPPFDDTHDHEPMTNGRHPHDHEVMMATGVHPHNHEVKMTTGGHPHDHEHMANSGYEPITTGGHPV